MIKKIQKTIEIKVECCDFCGNTSEHIPMVYPCCMCNADICSEHSEGEYFEDGSLCPDCSKIYTHEYVGDGSVGIRLKSTNKFVNAPYL